MSNDAANKAFIDSILSPGKGKKDKKKDDSAKSGASSSSKTLENKNVNKKKDTSVKVTSVVGSNPDADNAQSIVNGTDTAPSTSSAQVNLDALTGTLQNSLTAINKSLQDSFSKFGEKLIRGIGEQMAFYMNDEGDDEDYDEYDEEKEGGEIDEDEDQTSNPGKTDPSATFLDNIELNCVDTCGPEVSHSLSKLVDRFLSQKMDEAAYKKKEETYKRPKNIVNTQVPKINKPIWESLPKTARLSDTDLQRIQGHFLRSALPVTQAINILLEARGNPDKTLDIDSLITTLTDSLAFSGAANIDMISKRKAMVKKELPVAMKGLANQEDFSSINLFGDDLNANIKEVGELNKISNKLSYSHGRGFRGKFVQRRFVRNRFRRFPYPRGRGAFSGKDVSSFKKTLNSKGPSKD